MVRIPFGAAVGHTFTCGNDMQLTPFMHPRLSIDHCGGCGGVTTKLDVDVDIGVNYEITPQVGFVSRGLLGRTSYVGSTNAIGFSVAWTPKGLKKF